jgi:hypothetical protein
MAAQDSTMIRRLRSKPVPRYVPEPPSRDSDWDGVPAVIGIVIILAIVFYRLLK